MGMHAWQERYTGRPAVQNRRAATSTQGIRYGMADVPEGVTLRMACADKRALTTRADAPSSIA